MELHDDLRVGRKGISKFLVYLHVAVSLIILLESAEYNRLERYREILKATADSWNQYYDKLGNLDERDAFFKSAHALGAIMCVRLFSLCDNDGEWMEALENLAAAVELSELSHFSVFDDLDPQAPVNTFEKLWDNPEKVESWKDLANYCQTIGREEAFYEATVEWKQAEFDGLSFWEYATGFCDPRLAPPDAVRERQIERSLESESRLKNYFFDDCWDNIPEALQEKLKTIDGNWFSPGKRDFRDIIQELELVTQGLIRLTLWDSFIRERNSLQHIDKKAKLVNEPEVLKKSKSSTKYCTN